MVARHVKRIDTGEVFRTCSLAAESVGGKMTGLYAAMQHSRPYRGASFEYTDDPVTVSAPDRSPLLERTGLSFLREGLDDQCAITATLNDGERIGSLSRLFALLSTMTVGIKGLKLTDLKITAGGLTVEAKSVEIGAGHG